jgi:hypothetical protein
MQGASQKSTASSNPHTGSHAYSQSSGLIEQDGGESVRVVIRIRPFNSREISSGTSSCIEVANPQSLNLHLKNGTRQYTFHHILDERTSQAQVFMETGISTLLDSALEGYSATVFAYGQTGSGKTYTMAGVEERLGRNDYVSDETDGIIPRSISYLWQAMVGRPDKYFVKAGFFEIYNEQVMDLLNPSTGPLHCRWNTKKGFYVEGLLLVDCTSIDDLIAVLHEGTRNRKMGSHELNKDSSRSHSILTVYFICEQVAQDGHSFKKYGKVYFVDLAGSERLKESKSTGGMIKETGNINKSLFILGKVISGLGDKKTKALKPHIPYRDSKLTMVLSDSLGGSARALMIACVSPAQIYIDETANTLNYATRAMNIRNKPILQVDNDEHLILNLRREAELLRMENEYLKEQLARATGGYPPQKVDYSQTSPPVDPQLQSLQQELNALREANSKLREGKESTERIYHTAMTDNQKLNLKLENLESAFVGSAMRVEDSKSGLNPEHTISTLLSENTNLKKLKNSLEEEIAQLQHSFGDRTPNSFEIQAEDILQLRQMNEQLQKRVEYLQKREMELIEHVLKVQRGRTPKA